jgi:hypothetical protein
MRNVTMTSIGLAAGATLLLAHQRQNRRLDLRSETLERHHASNHFQRSPLVVIAASRRSASKNPNSPIVPHPRILSSQLRYRTKLAKVAFFRGAPLLNGPFLAQLMMECPPWDLARLSARVIAGRVIRCVAARWSFRSSASQPRYPRQIHRRRCLAIMKV